MKRTILLLLAILLWGGTSLLHAQAEAPFLPSAADARCKQWVDSVFFGLNLQEKVGQLIVTTFPAKADKQKKKQIRDLVKKYKIGGLLFAEGTPEEQAILTNIAQKNSKVPVMITFDGEWGLSMRLEGTPYFPKNAALGCIEDNQLIYEYGREVAREFRELGVHVNFAPDADVNTNPLNPVIYVRSFGEDPKKVAEKVLAYSRGLESGGVLSVSKHFPGHGDTDVDSHKGLPVLYYNRERLDSVELYPFREMVRAGLGGVMVGHLHILEPYTNLYRVWKDERLKRQLRNLIELFTDKILNPKTGHLELFFDDNWRSKYRIVSYGHDIEASWLIHEAALILDDKTLLEKVEPLVEFIAAAADEGLTPDGAMIYETFLDRQKTDTDRHWWVQAENVVGHVNLYQYFEDEVALQKAFRCWDFIKKHLVDYGNGEWHWSVRADGTVNIEDDKAGFWKCPYHNGRMCMEIMERFS